MFLLRHIRPKSTVLDVGCGRGATALMITRRVAGVRVEGVERDRTRADAANRRFRRAGRTDALNCREGDATELRRIFGRTRFDVALADNAFHEFWHPVTALREIRAILKPRGTLLLAELTPKAGEAVDDCPRYSRRKILEFLARAKFRPVSSAERASAILIRAQRD